MKIRIITYLSVLGIIFILLSQAYIVYVNYSETRFFLTRESDVVLESAFRKELSGRVKAYNHLRGEDNLLIPPRPTKSNTKKVDMRGLNNIGNNSLGAIDLAINNLISTLNPLNISRLDSITADLLRTQNINSVYLINIIDTRSKTILEQSKKDFKTTFFAIHSKLMLIDFQRQKSLQLVLINPFASIFKRMGTLLVGSLLISLFCFYGLWFLFQTLARQRKLMEVKSDFFGNTAHELKRPVAQLHLALEALAKPAILNNETKRKRYLAISIDATRDMSEKINMIMTLSMAEEGVFKLNYSNFNLLEEVLKLKDQFTTVADKEVSILIENSMDEYKIEADRDHLRQCMANLIDNAIKYSGSSVQIFITMQRLNDSLSISFKDNGIGIEQDKINTVFEKYTRLSTAKDSPTGFGIGLSYVKAVIEKHAGRIEVLSEIGEGSEFTMFIPV